MVASDHIPIGQGCDHTTRNVMQANLDVPADWQTEGKDHVAKGGVGKGPHAQGN
jgi:hypothetical protein